MGKMSQLSALPPTFAHGSTRGIGSENTLLYCKNSNTRENPEVKREIQTRVVLRNSWLNYQWMGQAAARAARRAGE